MLALHLLGPVALLHSGRAVALPIRKTQALLTLVALSGPIARERVAAWLWPDLDSSVGRRNLRRELARLRESGAAACVRADGDFLVLADDVTCDVRQFEAAVERGAPQQALALWRGPLADGLDLPGAEPFGDWLAAERERLAARRRRALEALADAVAPHEAVPHLQTLLADDPLQERHHRALMDRLLALGRREDALAQYEQCRQVLAEELGLTPMAETEALIARVRGRPSAAALPAPAPAPRTPPSPPEQMPWVGREPEWQALEAAWRRGGWLLIEGEGGVGKTRLALEFCATRGSCAVACCRHSDQAVPYAAFTRLLRTLAGTLPGDLPPWVQSELARVLPELGPAPAPITSAEHQARFFEACVQAWQQLAHDNFDAVVVDDAHHADASSQTLLAFVAQRGGPTRLVLLARDPGLLPTLREGAALHLRLDPLAAETVAELVHRIHGAAAPDALAPRLHRATGGNAFFIAETLRHLVERDALHSADVPLPASVRDAVLARVQRLGDAARRLLEAASLAAEPFAPALLAAACALSELEATAAIEQAIGAALLCEHDPGAAASGFAFQHDLARAALAASLSPTRRRLVHRRLALGAEATQAEAALTAMHFEEAGEPARALPYRQRAGDEAQALYAVQQALAQWERALADAPTPAQRAALLTRCAKLHAESGDRPAAEQRLRALRALLDGGPLPQGDRVDAAVACAQLEHLLGRSGEALSQADALLAGMGEGPGRVAALRVRASALQHLGRLADAQAAIEEALSALPAHRAAERAELLDLMNVTEFYRGRAANALQCARQAMAIWQSLGDPGLVARGHSRLGTLLVSVGDVPGGERELLRARALAAELRLVEREREVICNLAKIEADRGNGARVLELADEGWNLSPTFTRPQLRQYLQQMRLTALAQMGRMGQALTLGAQLLAQAQTLGEPVMRQYALINQIDWSIGLGDLERARTLLADLADGGAHELGHIGTKLALNGADLEIRAGNAAAAREALRPIGDPAQLQQLQDRAAWALRQAALRLLEADARGALAVLAPWRQTMPNVDLQLQALNLSLRAQHALGDVAADDWQAGHALLAAGRAPALKALELRRTLWLTAPDAAARQVMADALQAAIDRLCAGLEGWPAHQAYLRTLAPV